MKDRTDLILFGSSTAYTSVGKTITLRFIYLYPTFFEKEINTAWKIYTLHNTSI